jgi:DNA-binding CsgD family transcriptional regulator
LVARGQTAQEAGDALGIAKRTAETHLANATAKLRAINRVHAVALVVRDELVSA